MSKVTSQKKEGFSSVLGIYIKCNFLTNVNSVYWNSFPRKFGAEVPKGAGDQCLDEGVFYGLLHYSKVLSSEF